MTSGFNKGGMTSSVGERSDISKPKETKESVHNVD
jgi:hypothetical protein